MQAACRSLPIVAATVFPLRMPVNRAEVSSSDHPVFLEASGPIPRRRLVGAAGRARCSASREARVAGASAPGQETGRSGGVGFCAAQRVRGRLWAYSAGPSGDTSQCSAVAGRWQARRRTATRRDETNLPAVRLSATRQSVARLASYRTPRRQGGRVRQVDQSRLTVSALARLRSREVPVQPA
jgi:hypothetical protein